MALKVLKLRQKLTIKRSALEALREARSALQQREAELEESIREATTDEDLQTVEQAVEQLETETQQNADAIAQLEAEIQTLQEELMAAEAPADDPVPEETDEKRTRKPGRIERRMNTMPQNRDATWQEMLMEQRSALLGKQENRDFLQRVRELRGQRRSVNGGELGIPTDFMPILRRRVADGSKLYRHVTVTQLRGTARQNIAGEVPEGIWFEMDGALSELDLDFTQLEMDGFAVGGFVAVPNALLSDDDDLQLAATVVDYIGKSIQKAFDKAAIYGTGSKTPVGIVTRLAATSKPSWWGAKQGDFTDLHSSHVLKLDLGSASGVDFFRPLIAALGVADPTYSEGAPVWVMTRKTHLDIMSRALAFDAAAAMVAGVNDTFPVIGGTIEEYEDMPDYEIVGGYCSCYRVVEREGVSLDTSEHARFVENQTVFRGIARYDGKPAIGEAFVLVNYNNANPTTSRSFARDAANEKLGTLVVTTAAGSGASGTTVVTVAGATSGAKLKYQLAGSPVSIQNGQSIGKGWSDITSGGTASGATTGSYITVVEIDANGHAVKAGSGTVTAKA